MATDRTMAILDAIIARMLNFTPAALLVPPNLAPVTIRTLLGGAFVWIIEAPRNHAWPYLTVRMRSGPADGSTYGTERQFTLEVDCWHKERNRANLDLLEGIADQVEASLIGWIMPGEAFQIRALRSRSHDFPFKEPADRNVCRVMLYLDGWMWPTFAGREIGVGFGT
jgi:hypothetical protein